MINATAPIKNNDGAKIAAYFFVNPIVKENML